MTITCAFVGTLTQDARVRQTKAGKDWVSLNLKVEPSDWVSAAYFAEDVSAAAGLKENDAVFVQGRISLRRWENHAGHKMASLDVVATTVKQIDLAPNKPGRPSGAREIAGRSPFAPGELDDPLDDIGRGRP